MEKNIKMLLLRKMVRIRCFEEKCTEYKLNGKINGMVHCTTGQEAVDVGVCASLDKNDYILSNHRPHGHMIAKGGDVDLLMAEMFGKQTGTNGGKGGSMHMSDKSIGSLGATGIVGSGLPIACGSAFASKYKDDGKITCVFFGDGATNEGTFHECLNLASIWKLPIIFLLINNDVAVTTLLSKTSVCCDLYHRAKPYGINSIQVDGQNVEEVYNAVKSSIKEIKEGNGAVLIEAKTFRFHEHAEGAGYARMTATGYRNDEEINEFMTSKDPIKLYINKLINENIALDSEIGCIFEEEKNRIDKAIEYAENSSLPNKEEAYNSVFV